MDELDGRTPLQAARGSAAAELAEAGSGGFLSACAHEYEDRNEVLLASLMGIPPEAATGLHRGPLEALARGVPCGPEHMIFRADFVTWVGDKLCSGPVPPLSPEEVRSLAASLQAAWDPEQLRLEVSGSKGILARIRTAEQEYPAGIPPVRAEGGNIKDVLPAQPKSDFIWGFLHRAREILEAHPVNEVRVDLGENPANGIWLWGGGRVPEPGSISHAGMPGGCMLTRNDLAHGLARLCGMPVESLADPWVREDGKTPGFRLSSIVKRLRETDGMMVYIEAPMEIGRYGSPTDKVWALETLDRYVLARLTEVLKAHRPYRIVLATDGLVSTQSGRSQSAPLPVIVSGEGVDADAVTHWDEEACRSGALGTVPPGKVMEFLSG